MTPKKSAGNTIARNGLIASYLSIYEIRPRIRGPLPDPVNPVILSKRSCHPVEVPSSKPDLLYPRSHWWTQSSQIGQVSHGRDGHATKPSWHGRLVREGTGLYRNWLSALSTDTVLRMSSAVLIRISHATRTNSV